jgi:pilus assembly protein Flp/PilA
MLSVSDDHTLCQGEAAMTNIFKKFFAQEDGATAIEYGLIAALVSVAAIGALGAMGDSLDSLFGTVSDELDTAVASVGDGGGAGDGE